WSSDVCSSDLGGAAGGRRAGRRRRRVLRLGRVGGRSSSSGVGRGGLVRGRVGPTRRRSWGWRSLGRGRDGRRRGGRPRRRPGSGRGRDGRRGRGGGGADVDLAETRPGGDRAEVALRDEDRSEARRGGQGGTSRW